MISYFFPHYVTSHHITSYHITSHHKVAPAIRPDYYAAVIKRSAGGGAAVAGVATAPAAGVEAMVTATATATATAAGEGNGEPLQGHVQVQGQGQNGAARVPDVASASASASAASAPAPSGSKPAGAAAAPRATSQGTPTGGSKAPGAPTPSSPAVAGGAGPGAGPGPGATGARKGGKTGPLAAGGSSSKSKGPAGGDAKGTVIRMRGLPYRASKSEVMGFFKGCSIPEEGIAFVTRADGRVTGEAYVRFATREDAKTGIRKDREMMVSKAVSNLNLVLLLLFSLVLVRWPKVNGVACSTAVWFPHSHSHVCFPPCKTCLYYNRPSCGSIRFAVSCLCSEKMGVGGTAKEAKKACSCLFVCL